jgi:hypothetical protein
VQDRANAEKENPMKRLAYALALILLGGGVWAAVDYYKSSIRFLVRKSPLPDEMARTQCW